VKSAGDDGTSLGNRSPSAAAALAVKSAGNKAAVVCCGPPSTAGLIPRQGISDALREGFPGMAIVVSIAKHGEPS